MGKPNISGRRVLIIDDEKDFCLLMKKYLIAKNYEVHIFHTLEEGMKNLAGINPDFIFLDNNLPDGLGWEKTEFIIRHFPGTSLNLISTHQNDLEFLGKLPTVRFWEKPINISELSRYLN